MIAISHHQKHPQLDDVKPACARPDAMLPGIDVAQQAPEQAPTLPSVLSQTLLYDW